MAETIPGTDQPKIEAARRAMERVIIEIPERDGFNVGFRVYGHEGSNREEDRALSCRSSALLVPMDGIDARELQRQVGAFEPTGWTPLAFSLEQAAADFPTGGESIANAVILVTDGEETCGGDPCRVAAALNAAEIGLTTHVVGFALTPEQQEAVRCIAEEGGGRLFTAANAVELSEAVFAAFQEIEATPEAAAVEVQLEVGGFVGGNAFGVLEACPAGELAVIAVGPHQDGLGTPVVVCNESGEDVRAVEVAAVARDGDGGLIGEGATLDMHPYLVEDGGIAFGRIYFGVGDLPDAVTYDEIEVAAEPVDAENALRLDLVVEEINVRDGQIVGGLRNEQPDDLTLVSATIACFDAAGAVLETGEDTLLGNAQSGDLVAFDFVPEDGGVQPIGPCPYFLVAGSGTPTPF